MNATAQIVETVRNSFNFTVDPFPLSGPDGLRTEFYGLFRSDDWACVGRPVTKSYHPHQTEDVISLVDAVAEAFNGVANVDCYFQNGHYVTIQPSDETRRAIFGEDDNIWPRINIRAGYDGKAFSASMGYWRDTCRNLAIMRKVSGTVVNIRHRSGLRSKMADLIRTFEVLKTSWGTLAGVIENLENRTVDIADFLKEVYGEPNGAKSETRHRNRTEAILQRLYDERFRTGRPKIENRQVSAWEAYNAVQGYVQHSATRKHSHRLGDYGRAVAAFNDAAVARAEELVLELV